MGGWDPSGTVNVNCAAIPHGSNEAQGHFGPTSVSPRPPVLEPQGPHTRRRPHVGPHLEKEVAAELGT